MGDSCSARITPDMVLEGGGNDTAYVVQLFTAQGMPLGNVLTAAHLGDTIRAVVTHKASGNSCWGRLMAVDALAPVLACVPLHIPCALPDDSPAFLQTSAGLPAAYPTVTEACGPFTLKHTDAVEAFSCAAGQWLVRRIWRTWVASDAAGNTGACTQRIDVARISLDSIAFPADTAFACGGAFPTPATAGAPFVLFNQKKWPLPLSGLKCGLGTTYQDQTLPGCGGAYLLLRNWIVHDDCLPASAGNPLQRAQVIRVEDRVGPQVKCPSDTVIYTDPFACGRAWTPPPALLSDACSGVVSVQAQRRTGGVEQSLKGVLTPAPGNPWSSDTLGVWAEAVHLPAGETTVFTYIATDGCGNTASCSFRATVADGVPPAVRCKQFVQVALGSAGETWVWADVFDAGSEDNCSPVRFKARRADTSACQAGDRFFDRIRFCCSDAGKSVPVVVRVYDVATPAGAVSLDLFEPQANECEVWVQVVDKLRPQCVVVPEVQVSCADFDPSLQKYPSPTFSDNCCLEAVVALPPNYSAFDTLCHRGTIVRAFRATDCHGLSASCTQRIVVKYEAIYAIKFPDDLVLGQCDSAGLYPPGPTVYEPHCASVSTSFQDRVHQAGKLACYWIEREWRFIDWCRYHPSLPLVEVPNPNPSPDPLSPENLPGPVVAPAGFSPAATVRRVRPEDVQPTDFSTFWSPAANGYLYRQTIIIRDSVPPEYRGCPKTLVQVCDNTTNDPGFWNAPYWQHPLVPNSTNLCEVATELAATAMDKCSKGELNIQYRLYLDLDGDGVQETVVSSNNPPPPGMVRYGNAFTPGFTGGQLRQFDHRPVPTDEKFRFTILRGGTVSITGFLRWNTEKEPTQYVLPQLPHGLHRIEWTADDGCGNRAVCAYDVQIRDCRPPELICMQGLNVNLPNGHPQTLYDQDFLQSVSDNCTPLPFIRIGIRRAGAGQGFPTLPDGSPQKSVAFGCADVGLRTVEVWARDVAGNTIRCNTTVRVQDPFAMCSAAPAQVAGWLKTAYNEGLQDATLTLTGNALPGGQASTLSKVQGDFEFPSVPAGAHYTLTPGKNDDPLNGVSTFDLSLLNQHIIGLKPLDSPYKIIAADVNNSRSVTTADILELRKLILGIYTELPGNTSWRFVDADYTFPNPSNPFQEIFPEYRQLQAMPGNALYERFVAIKTGDLNGNAVTNSATTAIERARDRVELRVLLKGPSQTLRAGEEVELLFEADTPLMALQGTVCHPGLELLALTPVSAVSSEHFAVFVQQRAFTVAWDGIGRPAWQARFRATGNSDLRQCLSLSDAITPTAAFADSPQPLEMRLRFAAEASGTASRPGLEVYDCEPNPWTQQAQLRFFLPTDAEVGLEICDLTGKSVFVQKRFFTAGPQAFDLKASEWPASPGAYLFRLTANGQTTSGKMLRW
ncbi:MAG: hypothetical protein RMJ33_10365 [Saprospiraceae bacterium]|nr:hypothetical protein [Saprospiraceae bacterium]MDW8230230.1 hypothetical protein [Saprospiraceae bacterium]